MQSGTIIYNTLTVPWYEIKFADIDSYLSICDLLRPFNIVRYTYEFKVKDRVLKYGMSNDEKSHMPVERVYRQSGHIPGWIYSLTGPSGSDMVTYCNQYENRYNEKVIKDNVTLRIYDFTGIASPVLNNPNFLSKKHERHLIKTYLETNGELPPGNIKDEKHVDKNAGVNKTQWANFFSEI